MAERAHDALRRAAEAPAAWWAALAAVAAAAVATALSSTSLVAILGGLTVLGWAFLSVSAERPELGLVALVGAAALDTTGRVATVAGAPVTVYQLVATTMVGVVLWRAATGHGRLAPTGVDIPVLLFAAAGLAAIAGAPDPMRGTVTTLSLLSSVVLLYMTVELVDSPKGFALVVWGLVLVAAALGLLAVVERLGVFSIQPFLKTWADGIRARVTFKDPNIFASFLACAGAFAVPLALAQRHLRDRLVAWGSALAIMAGLAATLSRGAWVGFVLAMGVVLLFARVPARVKLALVALAGAMGIVLVVRVLDPAWIQSKVLGVSGNASFLYRIHMGRSALQMFSDHPLGVGPGNYPLVFPAYRTALVGAGLVESHTAYLTVLVEMGIVGLVGYVWLLASAVRRTLGAVWRLPDGMEQVVAVGALAASVSLLAQSLTYSLEASKFLWLTLGLGLAAARALTSATREAA